MKIFRRAAAATLFFFAVFNTGLRAEGCPRFVEFFPDPVDTTDDAGEYLEILLSDLSDTLFLGFEDKTRIAISNTFGKRLLLHRDTLFCNALDSLDCRLLSGAALPNSREMTWTLRQGSCVDTAYLPEPKPGKALQLDENNLAWVYAKPTPGKPNAEFETGVDDCGIEISSIAYASGAFEVYLRLKNCDSSLVYYESETLDLTAHCTRDSLRIMKSGVVKINSNGIAENFVAYVPHDEIPENDTAQTLLISREKSPLYFTEVHYCPEEGYEEWVELYNSLPREFSLHGFNFCDRGKFYADSTMVQAFESVLVAKDTAALRSEIGFSDARILKASFGALKNSADTLAFCYGEDTLDIVTFGKETSSVCPMGFNPRTGRKENTPGFQSKVVANAGAAPFAVELSRRSASLQKRESIRLRLRPGEIQNAQVRVSLLTEKGRLVFERTVETNDNLWMELPIWNEQPGVYFLKCNVGRYEKSYGIILHP